MEFSDELLSFSTRLVFSTDGLTNDLKVYWGNILTFFYSAKNATQRIRQKEIQYAIKRFKSQEEWMKDFQSLTNEDKILTIVFLRLLLKKAEAFDQPIAVDNLSLKIVLLNGMIGGEDVTLVEVKYDECLANLSRHENRRRIIVPASIWPLALDYVIKWIILIVCRLESSSSGIIYAFSFGESILFIGVFIYISYKDRKHNQDLFQKHKAVDDFKIGFQFSARKYTWVAFLFITSSIILNFIDVSDDGGTIMDYFFNALLFSFYYFIALRFFQSGRVSEASLLRQLRAQTNLNETLNSDKNNEAIVNIETEINSRTGRLDAYVLESALFGALAFSGFLQIIATDYVSFKELDQFSNLVFNAIQDLVSMDLKAMQKIIMQLYTKNNLFCLAAIETLLCSGFFIAVIASRLRFSNVADKVKKALEIAKSYNTKEELLKENSSARHHELFLQFNSKVNEQITISQNALEEISPISGYMEYFRNAGLLMFLLVLISCGLFVTSFLGWLYVGIGSVTWIYFNRDLLISKSKEVTLILQIIFIRSSYVLLIISLTLMLSGFLIRIILGFENTTFLIASGFFVIGLYVFLLVILRSHYDESFGEIEKSANNNYVRNWNAIQTIYGFLILLSIASLSLYGYIHYFNASIICILLALFLGMMNILIGYYCCKKRWLGILIGFFALTSAIVIFAWISPTNFGRLPTRSFIFLGVSFISFLTTRIWKNQFHVFFRNILATYFSILFILAIPFIYGMLKNKSVLSIPTALTSLYQHKTYKFDSLSYWLNFKIPAGLSYKEKQDYELNKSKTYRKRYGDANGFTFLYGAYSGDLNRKADSLLLQGKVKKDSVALKKALEFVEEQRNIHRLFKFTNLVTSWGLEAEILIELKRKSEAINSLQEIINSEADEDVKKDVKKRLKEIEEGKPKKGI